MTELQIKTNIHEKPSSESSLVPGLLQARFGREQRRLWSLAVCISGSRGPLLSRLEVEIAGRCGSLISNFYFMVVLGFCCLEIW